MFRNVKCTLQLGSHAAGCRHVNIVLFWGGWIQCCFYCWAIAREPFIVSYVGYITFSIEVSAGRHDNFDDNLFDGRIWGGRCSF